MTPLLARTLTNTEVSAALAFKPLLLHVFLLLSFSAAHDSHRHYFPDLHDSVFQSQDSSSTVLWKESRSGVPGSALVVMCLWVLHSNSFYFYLFLIYYYFFGWAAQHMGS